MIRHKWPDNFLPADNATGTATFCPLCAILLCFLFRLLAKLRACEPLGIRLPVLRLSGGRRVETRWRHAGLDCRGPRRSRRACTGKGWNP